MENLVLLMVFFVLFAGSKALESYMNNRKELKQLKKK